MKKQQECMEKYGIYFDEALGKPVCPYDPEWDESRAGMSKEEATQAQAEVAAKFRGR